MPRNEQVVVVLVASPSDLELERNRLEDLIRELNLTWSQSLSLRLDLVRWETHGYPGIGQDPQDVLNRELPDEPDIFIGLMWSRYGTETGRAGSGTEEEFNRALGRYRQDPESVRIMFYFKDAPLAPSNIDLDQLGRVTRFRDSLGSEGALYWNFRTLEEFDRLLRMHLSRQIQEFSRIGPPHRDAGSLIPSPRTVPSPAVESEELGLLDFLDLVDECFSALTEIAGRMSRETDWIGERLTQRTAEINEAITSTHGQLSRRRARALIAAAAADMMQYVTRMRAEIPLFRETLQEGADAAANAALISATLDPQDRSHASAAHNDLLRFQDALGSTYEAIEGFKDIVHGWPRMTIALNRAKRETVTVLQTLLDSIAEGRRIVAETIRTLGTILEN